MKIWHRYCPVVQHCTPLAHEHRLSEVEGRPSDWFEDITTRHAADGENDWVFFGCLRQRQHTMRLHTVENRPISNSSSNEVKYRGKAKREEIHHLTP